MSKYSDLLKDPRWQKIRLKIFERENFSCERCRCKNKTLHVHHGYYDRKLKPWEYDLKTLHCVCEDCHGDVQNIMLEINHNISKIALNCLENNVLNAILEIPDEIEREAKEIQDSIRNNKI